MDILSYLLGKKSSGGGGGGKYAPKWLSFYYFEGNDLTYETQNVDTSNLTSAFYMFGYCTNLTTIDISKWQLKDDMSLRYMFVNCQKLKNIDFTCFKNHNFIHLGSMFQNCNLLEEIDLKGCNFGTNPDRSFFGSFAMYCGKLKKVDLSSFDNTNLGTLNIPNMFNGCSSLELVDLRSMTFNWNKISEFTNWINGVPTTCTFVVKDQTTKNWVKSNLGLNNYNVVTVDEYEGS